MTTETKGVGTGNAGVAVLVGTVTTTEEEAGELEGVPATEAALEGDDEGVAATETTLEDEGEGDGELAGVEVAGGGGL